MDWQFKREESTQFEPIPEGKYRAIITKAEKGMSQSGNDMLKLTMQVSGQSSSIWHHIAFLEDRPEITNRMLTQLFDSFGIEEGNFDLASYVGKAGGICVKHDDQGRAKISYLLSKKQQEELPPFVGDQPKASDGWVNVSNEDSDLPF